MIYYKLVNFAKKSKFRRYFRKIWRLFNKDSYPFVMGNELKTIQSVLDSGVWNMSTNDGIHIDLEKYFAKYIGVKHAVLVSSGGMAIQMSLRSLGIKPGDEVIVQVDTCVANAFAILNAGATPIFSDISLNTFKLDFENLESLISPRTKAIIPVHTWGNSENMDNVSRFANKFNLKVVEDVCLAIGSTFKGKKLGQFGNLGIFSFGSSKPLQAGEGGFIVTNDHTVAKELRTMRNWGDMTTEYGIRDQKILSWNGRMSEVTAALIFEQLKGYPKLLKLVKQNANIIIEYILESPYLELADNNTYNDSPIYTQIVLRLNNKINKSVFMRRLQEENLTVFHANFEPITNLSFFKNNTWKEWVIAGDLNFVEKNYRKTFENSNHVYDNLGIGIMRNNYMTSKSSKNVIHKLDLVLHELINISAS